VSNVSRGHPSLVSLTSTSPEMRLRSWQPSSGASTSTLRREDPGHGHDSMGPPQCINGHILSELSYNGKYGQVMATIQICTEKP